MDAGKFSNLNLGYIGKQHQIQKNQNVNLESQTQKTGQPQDPTERVELGFQPMLQVDPKVLPNDLPSEQPNILAGAGVSQTSTTQPTFSLTGPLGIDFGVVGDTQGTSFNKQSGLTATNGLNSTSFHSISGKVLASANQMTMVSPTKMPTTSIGTFGLGSTEFVTSSGRVVSLSDAKPAGRMPTTSVATNGLGSNEFFYASGRSVG